MSLFQCNKCGCCENTATSNYAWNRVLAYEAKLPPTDLCSACDPAIGKWHERFSRTYLPLGMFVTAKNGNLAHKDTGDEDFRKYAIEVSDD
jgi:hypothetical protein